MKSLFLGIAFLAGAATAVQVPVNATLRTHLGHPMQATFVSFTIGMMISLAYCLAAGSPIPSASVLSRIPWWAWTGGILGTFYVASSIVLSPRIGIAAMLSMVIAGQMLTSLVIDHYGLVNAPVYTISSSRALGAVLVAAGAALMAFAK